MACLAREVLPNFLKNDAGYRLVLVWETVCTAGSSRDLASLHTSHRLTNERVNQVYASSFHPPTVRSTLSLRH